MSAPLDQSLNTYMIGGRTPASLERPATPESAAAILKHADATGSAVVPWGRGTKQHLGNAPRAYDLALDLTGLDKVVEYEPADLVVTAQAGVTLDALQQRLGEAGQFLALDPPYEDATLGGVLATNVSGPSRLLYGTARDVVLGLRVATPEGHLVKSGGKVVKNVVGYDLNKLHIGGLGTAGVMVEVTFKVHPLPDAEASMRATFGSLGSACGAAGRIVRSVLYPRAVDLLRESDSSWQLLVWAAGSPATVERQVRDAIAWCVEGGASATERLDSEMHVATWKGVRAFGQPRRDRMALIKLTCLPSQIPALVLAVDRVVAKQPTICARAGNGVVYVALPDASVESVQAIAAAAHELGGSAVLEDAPPEVRASLDVWDPSSAARSRSDYELMHAIKKEFDPRGTLNPGRFVAGI